MAADYESISVERHRDGIAQAVMLAPHGLVLPVLDPVSPSFPAGLAERLPPSLTVMGSEESVVETERALRRSILRSISYHLMAITPAAADPPREGPLLPGIRVRRATVSDLGILFPLQAEYEKEEVLIDPALHMPRVCRAHLKRALREQIVYLAEDGGGAVAKAGTNARGIAFDQIGGVFTVPDMRSRGIGRVVMQALLEHILSEKSGACLFVKRSNDPAIALYRRLGFSIAGGYRISYYVG
jgi:hypothetical protein